MKCLACLMNHENCRGEATQYGVLTPIISQVLLLVNSLNTGLWLANLYPGLSLQCSGHKWDASLVLTGHCCQEKLFSFKVLLSWKVKRISLSAEPNHFNWSASMTSFFEEKKICYNKLIAGCCRNQTPSLINCHHVCHMWFPPELIWHKKL